jgi:hypothetical protein
MKKKDALVPLEECNADGRGMREANEEKSDYGGCSFIDVGAFVRVAKDHRQHEIPGRRRFD